MNQLPHYAIDVEVETAYLPEQSAPLEARYVFSYTITLSNTGRVPAQLLRRHWLITDGEGRVQEVHGDGVVGEKPHLRPGERFRYTSGTALPTPMGTMQGSYQLVADDGQSFDAAIPAFTLSVPNALH